MGMYGGKEMAAAFRTVRKNTIQIAADIPEDKYDWAPAPGTRTVKSLLAHMVVAPQLYEDMHRTLRLTTVQGYDFGAAVARLSAAEAQLTGKAQIVDALKADGESFASWLESVSNDYLAETYTDHAGQNPKTRLEGLLSVKEHEMHHRGQLMLIQRILGMVPHLTRQMQERFAARAAAKATA